MNNSLKDELIKSTKMLRDSLDIDTSSRKMIDSHDLPSPRSRFLPNTTNSRPASMIEGYFPTRRAGSPSFSRPSSPSRASSPGPRDSSPPRPLYETTTVPPGSPGRLSRYDNRIRTLEDRFQENEMENNQLKAENEALKEKISKTSDSHTSDEWKEANDRVNVLIKENDLLLDQNRSQQEELGKLRSEHLELSKNVVNQDHTIASLNSQLQTTSHLCSSLTAKHDSLEQELSSKVKELDETIADKETGKSDLRRALVELKTSVAKSMELKRQLDEITHRYQSHISESKQLAGREKELMENLKIMESEVQDTRVKYEQLQKENATLIGHHKDLTRVAQTLENRIVEMEEKEFENYKKVHEQIEKTEEAAVEKEKATSREEQIRKEVERLHDKLVETQVRYREKSENEIQAMRSQFIAEKRKLNEEINDLESSRATMQSQMDRSIREKRAAESELEKLTRFLPSETERLNSVLEDLTGRLRSIQTERNEASQKLENLHQKYVREQSRHEKEKEQLIVRQEDSYKRQRKLERELEELKDDRVKLMTRISELDHLSTKLGDTNEKLTSHGEKELASVTSRYESQIRDLSSKLENVSEAHSKTCRDMQQLLADQRRMGEKWKDESRTMTSHYETALADTRAQLIRLQARCEELEDQLGKMQLSKRDLLTSLTEEKRNTARHFALLQNAEAKAEANSRQVQHLLAREAEVTEEKKKLERELDRIHLERERADRERVLNIKQENRQRTQKIEAEESIAHQDASSKELEALRREIDRVKMKSKHRQYPAVDKLVLELDESDSDI